MTLSEIKERHEQLEAQLISALSTMEKKDEIKHIRKELTLLQNKCSHLADKKKEEHYTCPYCGLHI